MNAPDKDLLDRIVREADSLPADERRDFLQSSCAGDAELFASAMSRLQRDAGIPTGDDAAAAESDDDDALIGQMIGPYRVLRSLGSGGMGEVVLAERADRQFEQQVAIKIVKRGLVSRQVQGRLRSERQILATLNHPNIAKLLDGGVTSSGAPYIVMEYIDGQPIDVYCDQRRLSIRDRLLLFQQVCAAVHSAHQRLIVHRDLKPSNILVTSSGAPKLLDFGIAKMLDERQSMHTVAVTHADYRVMTPDHASPEQIQGLPISTASDIYVLGVVLYELLTGRRPFDFATMRLIDIERAICEEPPILPSAAVETASKRYTAGQLEELAHDRATSAGKLRKQLRGDLDNIVMMAMRKEPERRYSSVEQLSADVGRYLDNLPVIARKDTWGYRASKFVRRHRAPIALAAALLLAIIAFGVTSWIQANRIAQERDRVAAQRERAEQQRERAEQVTQFLMDVFSVADPSVARGQTITARELLDNGARKLQLELQAQPATRAQLEETIGGVYMRLGLFPAADSLLQQSLTRREAVLGREHPDVAASLAALGRLRMEQGEYAQAKELLGRALELTERTHGAESEQAASVLHVIGELELEAGDLANAETTLRRALATMVARRGRSDPRSTLIMNDLGLALHGRGRHQEAAGLYEQALTFNEERYGASHPQVAYALNNLARVAHDSGDLAQSEVLYRRALSVHEHVLGPEHPETIDVIGAYGALLQAKGDLDRARDQFQRALELDRKVRGPGHIYVGHDLSQLGALEIARNDAVAAERYFRGALAIFEASVSATHPFVATGKANLGRALVDQGRAREAAAVLEDAVRSEVAAFGADSDQVAVARVSLGRALTDLRRFEQAEAEFRASYPVLLRTRGAAAPAAQSARKSIIHLYDVWGRPSDGSELLARLEQAAAAPR